jgi:hypothetical protein
MYASFPTSALMTINLSKSLRAWGSTGFDVVLAAEIAQLESAELPLQQGLSAGSHVVEDGRSAMVIARSATVDAISVKVGIFYASVLAGCSCADDPTPVPVLAEYCVVRIDIDRRTGDSNVTLLPE